MMTSKIKTGWPEPARPVATITLETGSDSGKDETLTNFSAGSRIGRTLFLAADESACLDRLTQVEDARWGDHRRFNLAELLDLDNPEGEADLEGLAADEDWLWVLGSHARTRNKKFQDGVIDLAKLADLKETRSRCLLARLPLIEVDGVMTPVREDGERRAAMLKQNKRGNAIAEALKNDPLIAPFTEIPAKEGGVDMEGVAVCGNRVALGMRGPVIATHALLVELTVRQGKKPDRLHLEGEPVKRLLKMEGLGIRDLKRCGDDLLILAGPTTGLSGPCAIYRWRGWVQDPPQDAEKVRLHKPERIVEIPFGRGFDHPEGLALWGNDSRQILVIYDSPAEARCDLGRGTITADLFDLPA
jgi:hypothetical protein